MLITLLLVAFTLQSIQAQAYCTTDANCPNNHVCYLNTCRFNRGPCVNKICQLPLICATTSSGDFCVDLSPPTTTTITTTATIAPCVDKVGPNGISDCPKRSYLCNDRLYHDLMTVQCPKTCNRCDGVVTLAPTCADKVGPGGTSNCGAVAYLCNNALYFTLMTQECPKTCGRCWT